MKSRKMSANVNFNALPFLNKEDMENLLQTANFSASMLLNLINDLLDLAKLENSSFNLNASYFNL